MQFSALSLSLIAAVAAGVALAQSTVTVNTPTSLIECQPTQITWSGGTAPYFPRITVGGDTASTLNTFDTQSTTSLTWTVNIERGTSVTVAVTDSTGVTGASAQVTINPGSTSCLAGGSSGSASASSSASTAASSASSSASSASSSAASSSSSASSAASSSTRSTSSSASTTSSTAPATTSAPASGADSVRGFSAAFAGLVGVVAAALL